MGAMFSTQKSQTTERSTSHVPLIENATLKSPSSGKLCDAMEVQVTLNRTAYQALLRKKSLGAVTSYYWNVDLELDVAHAKHLGTLWTLPTKLESPQQKIQIPGYAFTAATANKTIETLSNVCTIQLSLRDGEGHQVPSGNAVTVIMCVSQGSFGNAVETKEGLLRSFYGIDADDGNDERAI